MPDLSHSAYAAPVAPGPLDARLLLPGSKSLTNRELVLAALADGPSVLRRPLHARDAELMAQALRDLGAGVEEVDGDGAFGPDWAVDPGGLETTSARSPRPPASSAEGRPQDALPGRPIALHVGLAGTVMRFLPPVAALRAGDTAFDGDEAARRRPMSAMTSALRALGVRVDGDALPFVVRGTGSVRGGELTIDASASSQFVSGLLLAAPRFAEGLVLRHEGERLPSLPHIEMTIACLAARGVAVTSPDEGVWIVPPGPIAARDVEIEPDLSNAAPFLAAALVAGGRVAIGGWPASTTQVGAELPRLLAAFGASSTLADGELTVDGGEGVLGGGRLTPVELDLSEAGELAPTLVALAALAAGPSRFTGIGHLRGHETDRIAALVADLRALGAGAEELPDGIAVEPRPLHGGDWGAYQDHRMATSGALLGLAVPGVRVDDIGSTSKTLPEFAALWARMLAVPGAA
ncbi:MAG: 3-phosphoshikimate 1-carboxyvinyltransferase [Micrococcales bacterium 73-13]|nr:MAG: 3-phosphoshikimate 1-carboxyvinyltransferase [Micrococcales bacterium 73-13]